MTNLIGPLTAEEWCSLTLNHDDDPLMCCAVTSEFRSALFHVLRMGGDFANGHYHLAEPWTFLVQSHGGEDDIVDDPRISKIRKFYKLDEATAGKAAPEKTGCDPHCNTPCHSALTEARSALEVAGFELEMFRNELRECYQERAEWRKAQKAAAVGNADRPDGAGRG